MLCCAGALAEENALAATLQVADAYDELMLAHKKEVHCNIITSEVCARASRGVVVEGCALGDSWLERGGVDLMLTHNKEVHHYIRGVLKEEGAKGERSTPGLKVGHISRAAS
jgi:hypothetical protein